MKRILITGASGQIGTELTALCRKTYGVDNVIATNVKAGINESVENDGIFYSMDVRDGNRIYELVNSHQIDTIINLAALLSAVGEKNPELLWEVNMHGLYNCLEVAKDTGAMVFTPSSIAAFGPSTPKMQTPQVTIQRPETIYGVSKVAGELLCDYYHKKFNVDTRGVRYPGLVSYKAMPGGGTTDYAVMIFYEALKHNAYTCYLSSDIKMDMMYMPDALSAILSLCEADGGKLRHRNAYNITAMSITPDDLAASIQKHLPDFRLSYDIDPIREAIARSWPDQLDDHFAREDWHWAPSYDLEAMTEDMLHQLRLKLGIA
ncbi:NAD-dependent epimerase/dehydratase family protein [Fusibacter paucivorans]|uniref:NAD-dependent epimerase/dehydratase family protein n=1 Tax=Fusibacter paucivorans TaxID=76009 RepID=A0ABS5PSI5_9FIRM|nr:NAD-dependent epimerase/dehydratase family protein [Fusibacter paucivorans]MBS7527359.1 NAD-dependent epimerase/dehydratase family protein [Fusibacter paucivorans]